ncbi:MAG: primosomal protein N' [Propionibacteriaceae bacterium]|nr:primosomal protein N' [Propionibacteriaceae bacterium]
MSDGAALARVAVDLPLPHLDRFFDYSVPEPMEADAAVGSRVRVRFAGRACNGFIIERPTSTEVTGRLSPLTKVVSPEPVLLPDQVRLIRAVADHYAGTFADVARLAVAPRHAATESGASAVWPAPMGAMPPGGLRAIPAGESWLHGVQSGRPLRGFWAVAPGWRGDDDWRRGVVQAVQAALLAGKGAIVVVPDAAAMQAGFLALSRALGDGCVARLHAQMGPARRYHDYLALSRGQSRVVVGTRSAVFAPVHNLGLIVLVDDGNDAYAEPRAPYPHTRTVAALRASGTPGENDGCALLLAGSARSCEAQRWVERGWLGVIEDEPKVRRASSPAMRSVPEVASAAHLPVEAAQTIRAGLSAGPVLVQVPRAGYLVALACQKCRTPVRCPVCNGPVAAEKGGDGGRRLVCRWCGRTSVGWRCAVCGGTTLRAPVIGSGRTAEELGRAFPGFRVIDSSGDHIVESVSEQPALVVATPGAEPFPAAGYAAAVFLDADLMLSRADMRSGEEAVRRWLNAVSLVRQGQQGGTVCIVGDAHAPAVQAVLRADAAGFATRELADRTAAGLPPATLFVEATGDPAALGDFAAALETPLPGDSFGPVEAASTDGQPRQRMLWRCDLVDAPALVGAIKAAMARRSAAKAPGVVRVQVDPDEMG